MTSNLPHLVGMRAEAMRQSAPVCAVAPVLFSCADIGFVSLRRAVLGVRSGTACAQAIDFGGAETELFENLFIMLAKRRGALCWHFGDAMHLNRAADRRGELAPGPFER